MYKKFALMLLFSFLLLSSCNQQETAEISSLQSSESELNPESSILPVVSYPVISYPPASSDYISSQAVSSVFHDPAQTGDTVSLNIPVDEIVKIECLGSLLLNIAPTETVDRAQIAQLVQALNELEITDDNTLDYSRMTGMFENFILYYQNGNSVEIGYTNGGIIIRDSNYQYGNRWLRVRDVPDEKISMLLRNLH